MKIFLQNPNDLGRSVRPVSIQMYRSAKILENWKNQRSYSFEKTVENWKNTETWHATEKVLEFTVFSKVPKTEKTQFSSTFSKNSQMIKNVNFETNTILLSYSSSSR